MDPLSSIQYSASHTDKETDEMSVTARVESTAHRQITWVCLGPEWSKGLWVTCSLHPRRCSVVAGQPPATYLVLSQS